MPESVTRPLPARLLLLAAAGALALSLVWAVVVAEVRDVDRPANPGAAQERVAPAAGAAGAVPVATPR